MHIIQNPNMKAMLGWIKVPLAGRYISTEVRVETPQNLVLEIRNSSSWPGQPAANPVTPYP
jgi:hypothetical protein